MENPYDIKVNSFTKKMVKDLDDSFQGTDTWSHARNMMVNTEDGNSLTVTDEPSNTLCYTFDSRPLSKIKLKNNRLLVIQLNGEFGVLNTKTCSYEKLFQLNCPDVFNFTCKPILGESRIINDNEEYIVFGNEDILLGELNLSKIPYKYTLKDDECETKEYTKEIDCEQLLQFKNFNVPCIKYNINSNRTGNLPNGAYQIAIAMLSGGQKTTDYFSLSNVFHIYNENNLQGAIDLKISNIDKNFDQYQILLIANTTYTGTEQSAVNNESYYTYGPYDTSQNEVTISDISNIRETIDQVILQNKTPYKAGNIISNSQYLFFSDLIYSEPVNYQLQAMNIKIRYVIKQVPLDFYLRNYDFGYYGDENYAPALQWIDKKGHKSERFHIPGRKKTDRDASTATGDNLYELDKNLGICDEQENIELWQIENTASLPELQNNDFFCDERILAEGDMGYYESTEKYPDNKQLYGDSACTNIRYPKFPDECKVGRYSVIDGKIYINLKLWKFENIEHPKDKDGNYRTDIAGYQILRQSRNNGNKTVIATGMSSNIRGLVDAGRQVYYQNYPYNDQGQDSFHSLKAVSSRNNRERDFSPLTEVFNNRFSFYSPDAQYGLKTALGTEFKILTEEKANVIGNFEPVYNHPKAKLLTNFALYLSNVFGILQAFIELNGKVCKTAITTNTTTTGFGAGTTFNTPGLTNSMINECEGLFNTPKLNPVEFAKLSPSQQLNYYTKRALSAVAKVAGFTTLAVQHSRTWLDIIENLIPARNYAYQYNSVASFTERKCVNKRRFVTDYQYVNESNTLLKKDVIFNNELCNKTIFVELHKDVPAITYLDNSNIAPDEANVCGDITKKFNTSASMFYVANKTPNRNQYGQLDSGTYVKVHDCMIPVTINEENPFYTSPVLGGGDCIIVKTNFQTRRPIFTINLSDQDPPQGNYTIDYSQYSNLAYPRYWYNSEPYDLFDIVSKSPSQGRLPAQRHNLACRKNSKNLLGIKDEYIITNVNGIVEYIVEADANLHFREKTVNPHYSEDNKNLSNIFRADRMMFAEEFKLNPSYFKLETNQYFSKQQDADFDIDKVVNRDKNAIIYSLPGDKFQKINNWKKFLPNNYFSFDNMQFGNLVGFHQLDMDRVIFLFDKASPYVSLGRSELETISGDIITLGDGGLFARPPREIMHTDVHYGSTNSKYAFLSSHFGYFYPSSNQGRIFRFAEGIQDITQEGMHFWAKKFMEFRLKKYFPNYNLEENPLCGIGYNIIYDHTYEVIYICKKDYIPLNTSIIFNDKKQVFELDGNEIDLTNEEFFKSVSWTLSYRPKNEGFISFHDWHPDAVIQTENHFMTVKDNSIWKHNETCQSYCNFYGKQFPFEVTPIVSYGIEQKILNSFEYTLNVYHLDQNCLNKYHVLNENFDRAMVFNSEAHSGVLNLNTRTIVTDDDLYDYPKPINNYTTDIICNKKENRYRFNKFKNIVKDRGEISGQENFISKNNEDGYTSFLNISNFDTNKSLVRFRHNHHHIWLAKENPGKNQFVFKFLNSKLDQSPR